MHQGVLNTISQCVQIGQCPGQWLVELSDFHPWEKACLWFAFTELSPSLCSVRCQPFICLLGRKVERQQKIWDYGAGFLCRAHTGLVCSSLSVPNTWEAPRKCFHSTGWIPRTEPDDPGFFNNKQSCMDASQGKGDCVHQRASGNSNVGEGLVGGEYRDLKLFFRLSVLWWVVPCLLSTQITHRDPSTLLCTHSTCFNKGHRQVASNNRGVGEAIKIYYYYYYLLFIIIIIDFIIIDCY